MIITDITARNLLKYEKLDLLSLPDRGLIGISGENESGKSSVGEAICFALFGRSFSLGVGEGKQMLRWGAASGSVKLRFLARGHAYEISRFLDSDGNHSAKLVREGDDMPIATGIERVESALITVIGFDYDEYIDAFYLAQREIHAPDAGSKAVKKMAGLAALEQVAGDIDREMQEEHKASAVLNQEIDQLEKALGELGVDERLLPHLEQQRETMANGARIIKTQLDDAAAATTRYAEDWPVLQSAEASKRFQGFFKFLFLLVALLAGAAWYILTQMSDSDQARQLTQVLARIPQWKQDYVPYLHYVAGGAFLLFILTWMIGAGARSKIRELSANGPRLAERFEALQKLNLDILPQPQVADAAPDDNDDDNGAEAPTGLDEQAVATLISRVRRNEAMPDDVLGFMQDKDDEIEPVLVRSKIEIGNLSIAPFGLSITPFMVGFGVIITGQNAHGNPYRNADQANR